MKVKVKIILLILLCCFPLQALAQLPGEMLLEDAAYDFQEGKKQVTVGVRGLYCYFLDYEGFKVEEADGKKYETADDVCYGVSPYLCLWIAPEWGFEISYEYLGGDEMNIQIGDLSLIYMFGTEETLRPYMQVGACYGKLNWDGPGTFKDNFGAHLAGGVDVNIAKNLGIGLNFSGRYLENGYNKPDDCTASDNNITLSHIAIGAQLFYNF